MTCLGLTIMNVHSPTELTKQAMNGISTVPSSSLMSTLIVFIGY